MIENSQELLISLCLFSFKHMENAKNVIKKRCWRVRLHYAISVIKKYLRKKASVKNVDTD